MDIQQLLDQVRLVDVRLIERHAALKLDGSPDTGVTTMPEAIPQGDVSVQVNPISWGRTLETWFRMTLDSAVFRAVCAVAVVYVRDEDSHIDPALQKEFIERVSVMAAYPYLRAEIQHQVSDLRMGQLTLDLLKQGQFQLQVEDPAPQTGDEGS